VFGGHGSADERWRAVAARGAARFGSATASAVSDQVAPCSPPPNPSPINQGGGLSPECRRCLRRLNCSRVFRLGRACPGNPRLSASEMKAWIPGTRPGKTISSRLQHRRNAGKLYQYFPRTALHQGGGPRSALPLVLPPPRWGRVGVGVICAECVRSIGNRSNARGGGPADRHAVHRRQRRGHEGCRISTGSCRRRRSRRC
jgi:hypothetical protein